MNKTIFQMWTEQNINYEYCDRYDVYYNVETGQFLEQVREPALEGGEIFTSNWVSDGRPSLVPFQYRGN